MFSPTFINIKPPEVKDNGRVCSGGSVLSAADVHERNALLSGCGGHRPRQSKSCPCFSLAEQIIAPKNGKVDQLGLENAQPAVAFGFFGEKQEKNGGFAMVSPLWFVCLQSEETMRKKQNRKTHGREIPRV